MIGILNAIIKGLGTVLTALLSILPTSPFNFVSLSGNFYVQFINYLFPVSETVALLETYVAAVIVYYGLRIVLRWVKASAS